jgi:hypothetical protein
MGRRIQARRSGRFTRNTPENTLGLHLNICERCGGFNPTPLGEAPPSTCRHCDQPITHTDNAWPGKAPEGR